MCFRNTYDTPVSQIRVISEIALVIWSVLYLVKAAREATFLERKVYIQSMALCPSRVVFLFGCTIMVLNVPLRLACKPKEEDTMAITVMLCTGPYFLFFCRQATANCDYKTNLRNDKIKLIAINLFLKKKLNVYVLVLFLT